jgi:hypothetical protein
MNPSTIEQLLYGSWQETKTVYKGTDICSDVLFEYTFRRDGILLYTLWQGTKVITNNIAGHWRVVENNSGCNLIIKDEPEFHIVSLDIELLVLKTIGEIEISYYLRRDSLQD